MTDKQDYRQLITDLRAKESRDNRCLLNAAADAIETLLNGIEAYRRAAHREWVSVNERLPAIEGRSYENNTWF